MRRTLAVLASLAMLAPVTVAAQAQTPAGEEGPARSVEAGPFQSVDVGRADRSLTRDDGLGTGDAPRGYLVRFTDDPVATYEGDVEDFPRTRRAEGEDRGDNARSRERYATRLESRQEEAITRFERDLGRQLDVRFQYQYAVNGIAVTLTPDEARQIATQDGVADVKLDGERELQTDQGPGLIGAPQVWEGSATAGLELDEESVRGEGVIVGIIDSGINPSNPSFLDLGEGGGEGYDHTNPLGPDTYVGVCDPANTEQYDPDYPCNDKLIGAWSFVYNGPAGGALDDDGHGSHTASTAAGNPVTATITPDSLPTQTTFEISGVAPNANVISYMGCCTESGLTASIEQAIIDGVDVINYSIGSSAPSQLFADFDALGFLSARAEGIFVATSNGNDGPGPETTGSPSDAPWITSVGASTHQRSNANTLADMTGGDTAPPADIAGVGVTGPLGDTPIVYAGDAGDPLCESTSGNEAAFDGAIVVCDRGAIGRVQKSVNVAGQGALGFVLANDEPNGDSLSGDAFAIPGLHITFDDGVVLKAWLASGTGHTASITGTVFDIDDANADILAGFSSRGANRAAEVIVPDVIAPGVDVLAAYGASIPVQVAGSDPATTDYTLAEWDFLSGTSMASPHVAGLGALLTQARGGWSPAEMQSALMTTAVIDGVLDSDLTTPDPYDIGAGRVDIRRAVLAGLLFDESEDDYLGANPEDGGDFKTLNLPSFNDQQCLETCTWERTATSSGIGGAAGSVTWTPSFATDEGLTITMDQASYTVGAGEELSFSVTADGTGAPTGERLFGRVTLTPDVTSIPSVTMPVAVHMSNGVLPESIDIVAQRDAGSELLRDLVAIDIATFDGDVQGLVEADVQAGLVAQDTQPGGGAPVPYDNLDDPGIDIYFLDVPADTARFVAEIIDTTSPDLDLFVGLDADEEGDVDPSEEIASSASGGSFETVDLPGPDAGTYWILVQNWAASSPDGQDPYLLATGVVPATPIGNADVTAPNDVPKKTEFDARFSWDLPDSQPGDRFYGVARLGSDTGQAGDIGEIPVSLLRVEDDVTKTASRPRVEPGETVTYTVTIEPNLGNEDLTYAISDTLPEGMTYVPGSASVEPTTVDGQTITFEGILQETAFGKPVDYVASTAATNPACPANGYLDLYGLAGIQPSAVAEGDTFFLNVSQGIGPFPFYGGTTPQFEVSEDGFMSAQGGYDGTPFIPQAMPDPAFPNGVIAPLWADLEAVFAAGTTPGTEQGISFAQNGISLLVEYDDLFEWTPDDSVGPSVGDFEIQYYNYVDPTFPEIIFHYGEIGQLPLESTIGIENLDGSAATTFLNLGSPASLLTGNQSLCLDLQGPELAPVVITYDAVVDAGVAPSTVLTNQAVSTTDDPAGQPETASADVLVFPNTAPAFTLAGTNYAQSLAAGDTPVALAATDVDGDDLTYGLVAGDLPPAVTLEADGTFAGTVGTQAQGTWPVTVSVTDESGASDTASLTITVVNTAPVAVDDEATTDSGVAVDVEVLVNDTDADDDTLVVASVAQPDNGEVTCDDDSCTYTSDDDFVGEDTFEYTVGDGNGGEDVGLVTVTVEQVPNEAPVAVDDEATTDSGVAVDVEVLVNDTDADDDTLVVASVAQPDNGEVTCDDDSCTYTSDDDFVGEDTFEYTVGDGNGGEDVGLVTVTVEEIVVEPSPSPSPTTPEPTPTTPEPTPTEPEPEPTEFLTRVAGADRIATSIQLSQTAWPDGASTAIVVRADEYPDALAGVTMGAAYDAPVLLSDDEELMPALAAELERLGVDTAVLLGGEAALTRKLAEAIGQQEVADSEDTIAVVRVAGENRFATAAEILATLTNPELVSGDEDPRYASAIVALGTEPEPGQDGWVDALSAGTLATTGVPVLLTGRDELPKETVKGLMDGIVPGGTVYVVGGPVAVSDAVVSELGDLGFSVERVAGENRYATSVAAVDAAVDLGASQSTAVVASGRNYPDALSGAVAAWKLDGFLTLMEPADLSGSPETRDYLAANVDVIERLYVAGGPDAISDEVVADLSAALGLR